MIDADSFVDAIRQFSVVDAVKSTLINMATVQHLRVHDAEHLAGWFDSLADDEKKAVEFVAWLSAEHAATAFLSILDGAKAIESGPAKGRLELYYVRNGVRRLLNGINDEPLNDKL